MSHRSDLADVDVKVHHSTDKAVLVSKTGDEEDAVWVPKSQIELEPKGKDLAVLTGPEWLLIDKGLV